MSAMTLQQALRYADRAIARASELGLAISLVVVDEFGQLVQLDRMDGASLMSPDVAEAKALTALNFRAPTSQVAKMGERELEALQEVVHFRIVPLPGGVPIFQGGELQGAIGVSGTAAPHDEEIARHAVAA
jgi:uncharacterized protein GlcG (DUF336 family)